ncbi:CdaR family transcriptional regulator [Streptomyces sp. GbtcB6]|uniref:PucR family transcriptional regulator n=1 Tax=Streptomyces sp. GbtcB6 TaxID=2824751 RepID=UPI001C305D61|nr:helix-turn-helix domain-containing protein [Streptomyces sp. GbtcB6]
MTSAPARRTASPASPDGAHAIVRYLATEGSDAFVSRVLARYAVEIDAYRQSDLERLRPAIVSATRWVTQALLERRPLGPEDLAGLREYGALRARQGVPLEAMLRGWQVSAREAVEVVVDRGRAAGVPDAELMDLTAEILTAVNAGAAAFSTGHHRASAVIEHHDGTRRSEFLRRLLMDVPRDGTDGRLRQEARGLGLHPDRQYLALRAVALGDLPPPELAARLSRHGACRPPNGLVALVDEQVVGLSTTAPDLPDDIALGIGPVVPFPELARSLRSANRAATTAHAFALAGAHRVEDLGPLCAVVDDIEVGEAMLDRFVMPLGSGAAARALLDTVDCYLACGLHVGRTAEEMVVHENTVRYRITRYETLTGVSLRDPSTVLQLWWALRRRESASRTRDGDPAASSQS